VLPGLNDGGAAAAVPHILHVNHQRSTLDIVMTAVIAAAVVVGVGWW